MAETPGTVLDRQATGELQQKRLEGGSAPGEINDAQAGKATAAGIREQRAAGRDPGSVLGNIAAGEIGAEKPLPPKVQEQAEKMKALGKEKGIDDLRINIEDDEGYKKIVDKYKEQLSVDDFKDRYSGFSESPEFFRDREARVQALEEFAHDPATAEAAKLYEQHSVWFDDNGNPDSSRDVYYERAGKEAEDKTREALLNIQPDPIYQQHVREGVPGDEEKHREAQRLYDMQRQLPELYFTATRDAYSSHTQTISQDVKESYGNQETATRDVFAQEQLDWLRDVDKDVFNNGSSAVHRSLVVKAFLGPDAPQVNDENIIRAHFVIDTVSLSGNEFRQRFQRSGEQKPGERSVIISMLLAIKEDIDSQQKAKEAPLPIAGEQPINKGKPDEEPATNDLSGEEKGEKELYKAGAERRNFYDILGVGPDATKEQLTQAYKQLAIRYHPNSTFTQHGPDDEERFKDIQEAYFVLTSARETANYRAGIGKYKNTTHPDRAPQQGELGDEASSSASYAPKRGESWSTYSDRARESVFQEFPEGDPRREEFEKFLKDVNRIVYEEMAKQYKDLARAQYAARTGRGDFDDFYSLKETENRGDYLERVRGQLRQDLPLENFDEVFAMLSEDMFPPPVQPLPVKVPQPETPKAGFAEQVMNAALTDTGETGGLTIEQQKAKVAAGESRLKPAFKPSVEQDAEYIRLLQIKLETLQTEIDKLKNEGRAYPQEEIGKKIDELKQQTKIEFEIERPKDALWYKENSPQGSSYQTQEEIELRQ